MFAVGFLYTTCQYACTHAFVYPIFFTKLAGTDIFDQLYDSVSVSFIDILPQIPVLALLEARLKGFHFICYCQSVSCS